MSAYTATDFARRIFEPRERDNYPVQNVIQQDFYKETMGQFHYVYNKGVRIRFELINREFRIPLARILPEAELRKALDFAMTLQMRTTDYYYLRGMDVYDDHMFRPDYLNFRRAMRLPPYTLTREGDQYKLTFDGTAEETSHWEIIALATVMQLYYRALMRLMPKRDVAVMYGRAMDKLYRKLKRIAQHPNIRVADFALRRRHSFHWHLNAVQMAKEILKEQFVGSSDTYIAAKEDLVPIGTNAHEMPVIATALAVQQAIDAKLPWEDLKRHVRGAQYSILPQWSALYGKGLRVFLPDTYGSKQFFEGLPPDLAQELAHDWRGQRQDSGDPIEETDYFIDWLNHQGVAAPYAAGKSNTFSDGLDVKVEGFGPVADEPDIIELQERFEGRILTPFGWGSNFGNDFKGCLCDPDGLVPTLEDLGLRWKDVFRPFSLVCKVTQVNGRAAVKLSNNPGKATGDRDEVDLYKKIFDAEGMVAREVYV